MSTLALTPAHVAAFTAAIDAANEEATIKASLLSASQRRVARFTVALQAIDWIGTDGLLTAAGEEARATRGTALALAGMVTPGRTWTDATPLVLPAPVVEFPILSPGKPHAAAMQAGKDADTLLGDPTARAAAPVEVLQAAREASAFRTFLLDLGRIQACISEALREAIPAAEKPAPKRRAPRPASAPKDAGKPAPAGPQDASVSTSLAQIAASVTPEAAAAAKAAGKALTPSAPAVINHVAGILAMSDERAHAELAALLRALTARAGATSASTDAASDYVMAHAVDTVDDMSEEELAI